jgi:hypothetical protein
MEKPENIIFDAFEEAGQLRIARRPDPVLSELRTTSTGPDDVPGGTGRPAISRYPLEVDSGFDYAPWGTWSGDDSLPNRIEDLLDRVPFARQVIYRKAQMAAGDGIIYVKEADLARTPNPERAYLPDVEDFNEANQVDTEWFFPQALDFYTHFNAFSEMKLSLSRRFVLGLYHKEAPFSRLTAQDAAGVIRFLMYDAYFAWGMHQPFAAAGTGATSRGGTGILLPLFTWWDPTGFFDRLAGHSFSYHTRIRSGRSPYYARPPWIGMFKRNGWLDAAADVPRIVNAMQKNQINLKYQIAVEESYFKALHPEWDSYTAQQRSAALDKFEDRINETLTGVDKGYSSLLTVFKFDAVQQKELGKIEITAIDDKVKSDSWVPGAEKANFEITHAWGEHPTDFGLSRENGSMGSGSGSDKREVWNANISLNTIEQRYLLGPLNLAYKYNGFKVRAMVAHTSHTTSNLSESGLVPSKGTVQPTSPPGDKAA